MPLQFSKEQKHLAQRFSTSQLGVWGPMLLRVSQKFFRNKELDKARQQGGSLETASSSYRL